LNNWLKQRRKLCDEATDGPWNNISYTDPVYYVHSDKLLRDFLPTAIATPIKADAYFIASHDPATMRLIYDVVEAATHVNVVSSTSNLIALEQALEALQNKLGGDENPR